MHDGRWLWVLLNSGSCGAYAFNHDPETLRGVHSYRQPAGYFPIPGGTFAGESLPGKITWARAYIKNDELWMDVGRGEVVTLPPKVRDAWWEGTTRQWPFMAADLGCSMETVMAHYYEQSHRRRLWRHLRRDGGGESIARVESACPGKVRPPDAGRARPYNDFMPA